jgi:hypothetical protein
VAIKEKAISRLAQLYKEINAEKLVAGPWQWIVILVLETEVEKGQMLGRSLISSDWLKLELTIIFIQKGLVMRGRSVQRSTTSVRLKCVSRLVII